MDAITLRIGWKHNNGPDQATPREIARTGDQLSGGAGRLKGGSSGFRGSGFWVLSLERWRYRNHERERVDQVGRVIFNAPFPGEVVATSVSEWTVEPNQHRILQEAAENTSCPQCLWGESHSRPFAPIRG